MNEPDASVCMANRLRFRKICSIIDLLPRITINGDRYCYEQKSRSPIELLYSHGRKALYRDMIHFVAKFLRSVFFIGCILVVIGNGCIVVSTSPRKSVEPLMKQHSTETVATSVKKDETATSQPVSQGVQGAGYLSSGSTVSVGLLDGDEELKIFEKVRKLEKSLEREKEMRETLEKNLTAVTRAKEHADSELVLTRRELEGDIKRLKEENKLFEAKIGDLEEKLAVAELRPKQLEEKLIEAQISETKAKQELYKLKIDQLEKGEE